MKKISHQEPKLSSLILTVTSGLLLGTLLGVSILLSKQPSIVGNTPDEATLSRPGNYNTYYTPGKAAMSESVNLRSGKGRITRRTPGPVSFSDDEINYFFANIDFGTPVVEGEAAAGEGTRMGPFNVRIVGDQILASFKIVLDPKGSPFEMLVLANVGFENSEAGPKMVINSVRVNSLPVPGLFGLVSSMIESKVAETPWPDDVVEMWMNIRNIEIESSKLITEVGLRRA